VVDFWHKAIFGDISATMNVNAEESVTMQTLMRQLMAIDGRITTLSANVDTLQSDVTALKENNMSSSTSGRRIQCPMGCGADFKRVRELTVAVLGIRYSPCQQVTYLLDHLYRATGISQRGINIMHRSCHFNRNDEFHVSMWNEVFPDGSAQWNIQNVLPPVRLVRYAAAHILQIRHWCSIMAHKANSEANPSSPHNAAIERGAAACAFSTQMLPQRQIPNEVRSDWGQPFLGISSTDDESGQAPS
jgi:hypothetical protein